MRIDIGFPSFVLFRGPRAAWHNDMGGRGRNRLRSSSDGEAHAYPRLRRVKACHPVDGVMASPPKAGVAISVDMPEIATLSACGGSLAMTSTPNTSGGVSPGVRHGHIS
jgi:hypothetical protein